MELRGRLRRATVLGSVVGLTSLAGAGLVPTPARAAVHPTLALVGRAGDGQSAFAGDGGPASAAHLNGPRGVAVAADGDVFIADSDNNRIRRVTPSGTISTVAGTGDAGFSGDGGPALAAHLSRPFGVAVDPSGTLYIADTDNNRIRRVSPDGVISTIAGNGVGGFGGDGGAATAARLNVPYGVAYDRAGVLYIADSSNYRMRAVEPSGTISTVAGTGAEALSGDGGPATLAALDYPIAVATDRAGGVDV